MKLCRFVLNDAPELPRSGIYHEGKVYETDGERAIGIHDPGVLRLLTPLGTPPALRVFEQVPDPTGLPRLTYRFQNVTGLTGPNGEIEDSATSASLDFDVHVVGIVGDAALAVDPHEAPGFVLGYAVLVVLFDEEAAEDERRVGVPLGPSHDFGGALGPYLTTPDELTEFAVGSDPTDLTWNYRVRVNESEVAAGTADSGVPFSGLLAFASSPRTVHAGEVLAWPRLAKRPLIETGLGRNLVSGDRIEVTVDGLGTLVARLA